MVRIQIGVTGIYVLSHAGADHKTEVVAVPTHCHNTEGRIVVAMTRNDRTVTHKTVPVRTIRFDKHHFRENNNRPAACREDFPQTKCIIEDIL